MIKLRVELPIDKQQLEALVGIAYRRGYLREYPRKAWTEKERREAARYAVEQLFLEGIKAWHERGMKP